MRWFVYIYFPFIRYLYHIEIRKAIIIIKCNTKDNAFLCSARVVRKKRLYLNVIFLSVKKVKSSNLTLSILMRLVNITLLVLI